MAEDEKKEPKETKQTGLTEEQVEAVVKRLMSGQATQSDDLGELIRTQTQALAQIAEQSIPSNVKAELKRLEDEHESPYIEITDKVGVLTVSTIDLATIDGWPGYIDEPVIGEYTAQGLQKRLKMQVIPNYEPTLERRYSFEIMSIEDYNEKYPQAHGSIPNASMIASMSLRAGDGR